MRFKIAALSLMMLTFGGAGLFFLSRNTGSSKASEPVPIATDGPSANKYDKFPDLDCLAPQADGKVSDTFVLRKQSFVSPKGVQVKDYLVALKIITTHETLYDMQAVAYRNGICKSYYAGFGDEVVYPLNQVFEKVEARKIQLIWEKWKLENIPNWRERMQKRLSRSLPILSEEEYWALQQLGYRMPKRWKKVS